MSQTYARKLRRAALSTKGKRGTYLDTLNEALAHAGLTLHPTRGFRKINPKRARAQTIAEMTLQGFGMSLAETKEALEG